MKEKRAEGLATHSDPELSVPVRADSGDVSRRALSPVTLSTERSAAGKPASVIRVGVMPN